MLVYLQMIEDDDDKNKFISLYSKYRKLMYHISYGILRNTQDAEDAVQQAFITVIENLNKIDNADSDRTKSFLAVITERKAIDIYRERTKKNETPIEDLPEGIPINYEGDNELAYALSRLPVRYREVLMLRYDTGYDTKEIAQLFKMNPASVKKLIWRAKTSLAKILEKESAI